MIVLVYLYNLFYSIGIVGTTPREFSRFDKRSGKSFVTYVFASGLGEPTGDGPLTVW